MGVGNGSVTVRLQFGHEVPILTSGSDVGAPPFPPSIVPYMSAIRLFRRVTTIVCVATVSSAGTVSAQQYRAPQSTVATATSRADSSARQKPAGDSVVKAPAAPAAPAISVITVGDRGIVFASPDERTKLTLRTRIQNLAEVATTSESDLAAREISLAPRRVRLRLDGSVFDPRLTFKLQLSFSRRDQDFDETQAANVVRDAVVYWRFNPTFQVGYGQTKLPGNRQRVVSSSELQFAERSIVNNRFTLDRDDAVFARIDRKLGTARFNVQYALSLGEGRNQPKQGAGVANTGRVEFLPLGAFTDGGDYFEGDILREAKPKLSIGASYSTNSRTMRTGGQLGTALWEARSMTTTYLDALFKYRGFAAYGEYAERTADSPITTKAGSANRYIYTGTGTLAQVSYFVRNWEPNARIARTTPDRAIWGQAGALEQTHSTAGLTRYFNRHRIKLQGEVTHNSTRDPLSRIMLKNYIFRLNSEIGI